MKKFIFFPSTFLFRFSILQFFTFLLTFVYGQNGEVKELWKAEPFGGYDLKSEISERRTANEKHFQRPDGQVDMFASSEPINYYENGQWKTIYTSIEEKSAGAYKFINSENVFKSFYSEDIQGGFRTEIDGKTLMEMGNAEMYYERNGEKLGRMHIASSQGVLDQNQITYQKIYGNHIDLRVTQLGGKRKLDYIINDRSAIDVAFHDAEYLVFSETIVLPSGWQAEMKNGSILLINEVGDIASVYEAPIVFDSQISERDLSNSALMTGEFVKSNVKRKGSDWERSYPLDEILYEIDRFGETIQVLTKVKLSFLLNESRVFPIIVDPTISATVATITTGYYYDYQVPYGPNGVATTGAPAGSAITNVNLAMNVTRIQDYDLFGCFGWCANYAPGTAQCGSWHTFSLDDGTTGVYTCGGNLSTWNCLDPNRTWWTEIWSVDGYDYRARWGYTVTVTYETVTAPTSITATTNPICAGGSTTLTPAGGTANAGSTAITNQWFTGSCGGTAAGTGATLSVSPTSTTTYYVRRVGQCSTTGCASVTITVNPTNTIAAGVNRTTCINSAITAISLATTGATGATFSGLPAGVTGSWAGNVVTISGTPTASGTFNYTVTTTGGCPPATATGTITVNPANTIAAGIDRTTCVNTAITSISLATTGATGATFSGLPAGVTGSWAGNVVTISGTPTASGTFNYTVTTTGGCPPATAIGTITVNSSSTAPTIAPIAGTICPNTNTTLTAAGGTAGTGSNIYWYTGPNGTGSLLGTGSSIIVTPTSTTTYFARREGTCNNSTDATVTVDVKNYYYATNGTSSSNYCTDNAGWHHFYSGDQILFSVQGDLSGAPVGFPVASIAVNGTYYQQSGSASPPADCGLGISPGEERFEMRRSWNLDFGGGIPTGSYSVRFYYQPAEKTAIETAAINHMSTWAACGYTYKYATPLGFYWFKNSGSNYSAPLYDVTHYSASVGTAAGGVNYAEWTGITGFSGGSGAVILVPSPLLQPLPVELNSFTATCNDNVKAVEVEWTTASEHNSSHFVIDRSFDGINWDEIGSVTAAGNSNTPLNYSLLDDATVVRSHEVIYYRMHQFDNDGVSKEYGPASAECKSSLIGMELFPNPASSLVNVVLHGDYNSNTFVVFTDMQGKEVRRIQYEEQAGKLYSVDVANLEPGVYLVRLMDGPTNKEFVRFVKR